MEDRKADADTHLAIARSQNTENGILGEDKREKAVAKVAALINLEEEELNEKDNT